MQADQVGRLLLCALCVLPGCSGSDTDGDLTGPGGGALEVITSTSGVPEDPDGYAVTVDGGAARPLAPNGADTVAALSPGPHAVELTGIAGFCALDGENPRTVEIAADETVSLRFDVTCDAPVFRVGVSTTGFELDSDGYELSIDDTAWGWALPDDTVLIPNLSSGPHTVTLTGVAPNCAVNGEHPRTIDVVDGVGSVHLDVVCHFAFTLGVYVESNGGDPDPDGFVATLNDGSRVGVLGNPVFSGGWLLSPGDYTVTLSDVAPHCTLAGSNAAAATVTSGEQAIVNFAVTCGAMRTGRFGRDLLVGANTEINLLSADGSRFVNLTHHPDNEVGATWSPDGRRIAFASRFSVVDIPGPWGQSHLESRVFTMSPDGAGRTQLTFGYLEEAPAWSPDGGRLAFIGTGADGVSHLYVMNADGSGQTPLTSGSSRFSSSAPAWSPDGSRIAYSGLHRAGIHVISPDGSGEARLSDGDDAGAAWSPDGSRIAFVRFEQGQGDVIHVMNADGGGLIRVSSDTGGGQRRLSWSPDGTKIAFELNGRIYLANGNGTGQAQLTFGRYSYYPIWSPDGSRIAYYQTQENETRLYLMALDGSGEVPLTPAWALGVPYSPAAPRP